MPSPAGRLCAAHRSNDPAMPRSRAAWRRIGLDDELHAGGTQLVGHLVQLHHRQHRAEVTHKHLVVVDGAGLLVAAFVRRQMGHDLVAGDENAVRARTSACQPAAQYSTAAPTIRPARNFDSASFASCNPNDSVLRVSECSCAQGKNSAPSRRVRFATERTQRSPHSRR